MKITLILICLFIYCNLFAQNYRTVKSDAEYYYICTSCDFMDINAISIDSSIIHGNDTILYNFRSMRNPVYGETCGNLFGASWLGDKVIIKPDGYNLFFNKYNDTLKINTQAQLHSNWIFYKFPNNNYIKATIYEIDTSSFLGITDSIKVIGLYLMDINGDSILPYDYGTLKISKNYGYIQMLDFYEFPFDSVPDITSTSDQYTQYYWGDYNLIGKTNPTIGTVNIKAKDIYNYNIGDEFHTEQMNTYLGPGIKSITNLIKTIIGKTESLNHDTIVYSIKRCGKIDSWTVPTDHSFIYYDDTITTTYIWIQNQYNPLDELPNKTYNNYNYDYYDLKLGYGNNNNRIIKWNPSVMAFDNGNDSCYHMGIATPPMMIDYYIDGCGAYFNNDDFMFNEYHHLSLVYYKKGTETWGSPYNCNTLLNSIKNTYEQTIVTLYPNPIETISCLEVKNLNDIILVFNLYNSMGKIIRIDNIVNSNKVYIKKGELLKGIYFYHIKTKTGKSLSGKLMVN